MRLNQVRVLNYKCYRDSGDVPIGETFTVIVGKNNSGKTAFLESLSTTTFKPKPHRSPLDNASTVYDPHSKARYSVYASGPEILHRFLSGGGPLTVQVTQPPDQEHITRFLNDLFGRQSISFQLERKSDGGLISIAAPSHQAFQPNPYDLTVQIVPNDDRQSWRILSIGGEDTLAGHVGAYLDQSVYVFRAERMNVGVASIDHNPELHPAASNLPSVLLQLPMRPGAHDQYLKLVHEVFPTIYRVVSTPIGNMMAEVNVISNGGARDETAPGITVALNDSGTGISQVLAILYVAVTAPAPRIIVIDEPNTFLHPGAAKKLLTILGKFDHQYIIATHSPEIIKATDPEYVHLLEWEETEAKFRTLDRSDAQNQRRLLGELGVSLSDVFGAENVIWVEGTTEYLCFPLLLAHQTLLSPATVVVPLIATGDLEGRRVRANLVWQAYEQLSRGSALIPPALSFSLDREGRTDAEMDDLKNRSSGAVKFLPRRTLENYLLDADALAAVLNDTIPDSPITADAVAEWLKNKREQETPGKGSMFKKLWEVSWVKKVDAPTVLKELFWDLAKTEYRKTTHSVELVRWLLKSKPAHLKELLEYVASLVRDTRAVSS
jgi:predicted ATPase